MLEVLPAGNAGVPISSPMFSLPLLAVQALLLHTALQVPSDMLWGTSNNRILANVVPQVHEAWLFRRGTRGNFAADAAVCAARPPSVRPRHAWRWAFPPPGALRRLCRHAFEHAEAAHVIDQVLHPDLRLG